jgi:hypothetical protein
VREHDNFHAAILFVAEPLIKIGSVIEIGSAVADDGRGVNFLFVLLLVGRFGLFL